MTARFKNAREARTFLEDAIAAGQLTDIGVVGFQVRLAPGYGIDDPRTLTEASCVIEPCVDPRVEAILYGETRRGVSTWSLSGSEENGDLTAFFNLVARTHSWVTVLEAHSHTHRAAGSVWYDPYADPRRRAPHVDGFRELWHRGTFHRATWSLPFLTNAQLGRPVETRDGTARLYETAHPLVVETPKLVAGVALVSQRNTQLFVKIRTSPSIDRLRGRPQPQIRLDLWPLSGGQVNPTAYRPHEVIQLASWLAANDVPIVDPSGTGELAELTAKVCSTVAAWPEPGSPAQAQIAAGRDVTGTAEFAGLSAPGTAGVLVAVESGGAGDVGALTELVGADRVVLHPVVETVGRMANAAVYDGDDRLRPYQREAVGVHLAIGDDRAGFVNAIEPGMGKTVTTLTAMRVRAQTRQRYRALIVVEANVRQQWTDEAAVWFPEATVVTVTSKRDFERLRDVIDVAGPVVVVVSYALVAAVSDLPEGQIAVVEPVETVSGQLAMFDIADDGGCRVVAPVYTTVAELLAAQQWDDIAADEAAALRSTSKQSTALWRLRENARAAVALTGTPISKSLEDIGRLVAWATCSRSEFHGLSLVGRFGDLSTDEQRADYQKALGPLVFRRNKQEISDEIPELSHVIVPLEPSLAELRLAQAAQYELARLRDELQEQLDLLAELHPDDEQFAEVSAQLRTARGAALGGVTLARMAASDATALIGSESAGALLLADQVAAATVGEPTKRRWLVDFAVDRVVSRGVQMIVFTEFARVAEQLIVALGAAGLRVGGVLGGGGRRRDLNVAAFQRGELDVLVCTASGEKGLNLQCASVVVHYDLPWTPDAVIQRVGRVERIGATADQVEIVLPTLVGTIDERIAATVASRALVATNALDVSRGVDVADTDTGRSLAGVVASANADNLNGSEDGLLARIRELVGTTPTTTVVPLAA